MNTDRMTKVLVQVARRTLKQLAGFELVPCPAVALAPAETIWSEVQIVEPVPARVIVAMDSALADRLAAKYIGDVKAGLRPITAVFDTQAELVTDMAARLTGTLMPTRLPVILGAARTGIDMPDVNDATWMVGHLKGDEGSMSVFVQGDALIASAEDFADPWEESTEIMPFDGTVASAPTDYSPIQDGCLPPSLPKLPPRIGTYRIIDRLGIGGMGVVYKAHHDNLHRLVALKVMRPELAKDQGFIDRFLREGHSTANVDHPNVVPVYDAGYQDGFLYLAMRFVPGGDLATLLHRTGVLTEDHALLVIQRCLDGLQAIFEAGMIHRDIKPANILLESNGVPRLADLGLARTLVSADLSLPGAPQGTPTFMSPEQARAATNIDIRCDIYSLGVTLFCMLCGRPPFMGDSPYDVVAKVLYEATPDPRTVDPAISVETVAVVAKAMAKHAKDRYQTPMEFRHAVENVLKYHGQGKAPQSTSGEIQLPTTNNYWVRKAFHSLPPLLPTNPSADKTTRSYS
jgi:serine/threonine protein kinase